MNDTRCLSEPDTLPAGTVLRAARPEDGAAIVRLHERVFGPGRFARTAFRVREGTPDISPLCQLLLLDGTVIGALRMTPVMIGGKAGAALLGPLAVDVPHQRQTFGRQLIAASLEAARVAGLELVILVGDLDYYGQLGFVRVPPGQITLPGPVDPLRVLAHECGDGSLNGFSGTVIADARARQF